MDFGCSFFVRTATRTTGPANEQGRAFAWTGHATGSSAYTVDGLNRYSAPGTFAYDANGNLTGDGATAFTYDVENRLVSASGARNGTLVYDPLGRIFQYGAGGTTRGILVHAFFRPDR